MKHGELGASYHVVASEWPAVERLKRLDVPNDCAIDPGDVDQRFRGMAPGRLVPLLIVWLQRLEARVAYLEEERATRSSTQQKREPPPPPGWFGIWAPW